MALKRAIKTGGNFLDLRELARGVSGGVLAVFRIREFRAAEHGQHGPILPVIAEVLVCSGPRAGEVHAGEFGEGERFFGAITSALRGVKNPKKGEAIPQAQTAVGDDVLARIVLVNEGAGNEFAAGNEPSDSDETAAQMYYRDGAGFTPQQAAPVQQQAAPVQQQAAPVQQAPAGEPAMAGAGSGRPWDN